MTRTLTIDSVDVTDKVRIESLRVEMKAVQGEVGTGSIDIDDTTGTASLAPVATEWSLVDTDATPTTVAGGYVAERAIDRGPLKAGTQRQFVPVLEDWNTALTDRVFGGAQANRPEETDYQRITWLLGTNKLGMLGGAGQVPNSATVTMDPTDYRGKTPLDVLDDCAESANKNFYVYYDASNTDWRLYYDKIGSVNADFTSDLFISDLDTDIDSATTFGASDIDYTEDPERVYSGLNVKWANGWIFESDPTTESTYRRLQKTVIKENITTAARARAWATRQLEKLNEPTKRLALTVSVPGSALGELRAGWRIRVKLRSRGITAYTYFRIASTSIRPREGRDGVSDVAYDVRLEMVDKIRAVNLDDSYGGGDSSGNPGTGSNILPPFVGDDSGDGSSTAPYVLDDFDRSSHPAQVNTIADTSTGTSHTISIPDGSNVVGRELLLFVANQDWTVDVQTPLEGEGFTAVSSDVDVPYQALLMQRRIDGTEGFTGTGDTITFSTSSSVTFSTLADLYDGVYVPGTGEDQTDYIVAVSTVSWDPPLNNGPWYSGTEPVRWIVWAVSDGTWSGTPTGYTLSGTANDQATYYKNGIDSSENPGPAFTPGTGTQKITWTIQLRGTESSGWGTIPQGGGVDTEAPWEGGNEWIVTEVTGSADVYVDGTDGRADITADGTQVSNRLESNAPDDPSDEPWGPWAGGDAEYLMRWKVNPVGDTADTSANLLETAIVNEGLSVNFRIHLGDAGTYAYQSGGDERGIVILQGATASSFVQKTIASDTYYLTRMDFRGTRCRMKQWAASAAEPVDWDIDVAKVDASTSDVAYSYWRAYGNDGMAFHVDYIDAVLGAAPGAPVTATLPPGDGTTTTWTIAPWTGGITVWVDGIQTPVTTDASAGTFTFDRAPADGAVIRVEYTPA